MAIRDEILTLLQSEAIRRSVRVRLKTNLGPAITIYDARRPQGASLPMIRAGVVVEDASGARLFAAGGWPETDWPLAAALGAAGAAILFFTVRGIMK